MPKLTQLEPGIILKQEQQNPSLVLPNQSVDTPNITPGLMNAIHPVGATMSAFLTEPQFQAQMGTGWVLADGRSVAGSTYSVITGNTNIPDARGLVLRGSNNGGSSAGTRADGNQDPAGVQPVGTYEADSFASHNHGISSPGGGALAAYDSCIDVTGAACNGSSNQWSVQPSSQSPISDTASTGGAETRVKAMIVNHFIRIN